MKIIAYCHGQGCALHDHCQRYADGRRIQSDPRADLERYLFFDHCNEETRDGLIDL